jgi:ribonuclease E
MTFSSTIDQFDHAFSATQYDTVRGSGVTATLPATPSIPPAPAPMPGSPTNPPITPPPDIQPVPAPPDIEIDTPQELPLIAPGEGDVIQTPPPVKA